MLADVDAVDLDRARVDVVQPRDQVGRGRLAGPGRPDERHELARLGLEVDVAGARTAAARRRPQAPSAPSRATVQPGRRAPPALGGRREASAAEPSAPRARARAPRPQAGARGPSGRLERHVVEADPAARRSPGRASTASGASTISGSISRYSKIRSNRASAPWISTWTLSSWPSGKNRRRWSVVNATMSPIVGAVGSPWIAR